MKSESYQTAQMEEICKYFKIVDEKDNSVTLKYGKGRNTIKISVPFILDEDIARLAGLMPDGSLIKDLRRIYFHQTKDLSKIYLFRDLLIRKFSPDNKIFVRRNRKDYQTYTNSLTLARFFYHILRIPKSNEQMKVPEWLFDSPESVKNAYLREAFDMEGTILKKLSEIRFITKDYKFATGIKRLLESVGINSHVKKRIGGTNRTLQYRVSIYRKENFEKFKKIGFGLSFHKERFEKVLNKYGINATSNSV